MDKQYKRASFSRKASRITHVGVNVFYPGGWNGYVQNYESLQTVNQRILGPQFITTPFDFTIAKYGMTLKKAYKYVFYKLYKIYDVDGSVWWGGKWLTDWKASVSLLALEFWLLMSFVIYYEVITKNDFLPDNTLRSVAIAIGIILVAVKYFVFWNGDRWKKYVKEFDRLPKRKNRIGTLVVWTIVILIIANLIFSYYLMSQIDWKQYR